MNDASLVSSNPEYQIAFSSLISDDAKKVQGINGHSVTKSTSTSEPLKSALRKTSSFSSTRESTLASSSPQSKTGDALHSKTYDLPSFLVAAKNDCDRYQTLFDNENNPLYKEIYKAYEFYVTTFEASLTEHFKTSPLKNQSSFIDLSTTDRSLFFQIRSIEACRESLKICEKAATQLFVTLRPEVLIKALPKDPLFAKEANERHMRFCKALENAARMEVESARHYYEIARTCNQGPASGRENTRTENLALATSKQLLAKRYLHLHNMAAHLMRNCLNSPPYIQDEPLYEAACHTLHEITALKNNNNERAFVFRLAADLKLLQRNLFTEEKRQSCELFLEAEKAFDNAFYRIVTLMTCSQDLDKSKVELNILATKCGEDPEIDKTYKDKVLLYQEDLKNWHQWIKAPQDWYQQAYFLNLSIREEKNNPTLSKNYGEIAYQFGLAAKHCSSIPIKHQDKDLSLDTPDISKAEKAEAKAWEMIDALDSKNQKLQWSETNNVRFIETKEEFKEALQNEELEEMARQAPLKAIQQQEEDQELSEIDDLLFEATSLGINDSSTQSSSSPSPLPFPLEKTP